MTEFLYPRALGILGGTFDPIHYGHLRPCLDLLQQLDLAEVRLMPNHIPPHRTIPSSSAAHRLAMTELAIADCPELRLDTRELSRSRSRPSYTVETLIELAAEHPETPLCFFIGLDSLNSLHRWHRWQELLDYCHLVVSYRPGYPLALAPEVAAVFAKAKTEDAQALRQHHHGHILLWPSTQLEISATRIRNLLQTKQNPKYLLPDAVLRYIKQHKLYI